MSLYIYIIQSEYIKFTNQEEIPFQLEIQWRFGFMPANVLIDTLELTVMQDDPNSLIFYKDLATTDSITWYIHTGLTTNIINCSYESDNNDNNINNNNDNNNNNNDDDDDNNNYNNTNDDNNNKNIYNNNKQPHNAINDYNLFKIKDVIYIKQKIKIPKLQKIKNKLTLQKFNSNVHFNGIPVVKYDQEKNNSFLWQEIPENENYTNYIDSIAKGEVIQVHFWERDDVVWKPSKFNKIDLTKSANKQFGFILKAVIKGITLKN